MGKPGLGNARSPHTESIGVWGEPGELKHLSSPRKRKRSDSVSSGERKRNSLNPCRVIGRGRCDTGVVGSICQNRELWRGVTKLIASRTWLESWAIESDSLVGESDQSPDTFPSSAGHEEPCVNLGGPPPKAKYSLPPIAHSTVRER